MSFVELTRRFIQMGQSLLMQQNSFHRGFWR
jgi:hypothetical protein